MKLPVYINALSCISPQNTFDNDDFWQASPLLQGTPRRAIEPNYKTYISSKYLRRMGRMVRMGVCTAKKVLLDAGVDNPDAILVGTGMGCLHDTEEFLTAIYNSDETIASPNQFIQSTHNNVAAQIAIMLGCYNYNFTYVHRGFSFESALMDAAIHLMEAGDKPRNVLVGASDELTDMYLKVTSKLKPRVTAPERILSNGSRLRCTQGEGAAFFSVGNVKAETAVARIDGLQMIYKPSSSEELHDKLNDFLNNLGFTLDDIDLVLLGFDGGENQKSLYGKVVRTALNSCNQAVFKHLCGEYKTAGAFATWLAANIINKQIVPDFIKLTQCELSKIDRILVFNNYNNSNYTLSLLSHA